MGAGGRKTAPGGASRKSVTMHRANVAKITSKIVNYALVRQNMRKNAFQKQNGQTRIWTFLEKYHFTLFVLAGYIALSYSFLKSQCGGKWAPEGAKWRREVPCEKA